MSGSGPFARGAHLAAELRGRCVVDRVLRLDLRLARDEHDTVLAPRRLRRDLALDDVAQDELGLALERIAPAAAAGRHDAHDLPRLHRLAVDESAEPLRRAVEVDGNAERLAGLAAGDAVAAEPHAVGGHDRVAIDEHAVVLVVPEPAAALPRAARVGAQAEPLDDDREAILGELRRLVPRVGHDVDRVVAVGVVPPARAAADHLAREEGPTVRVGAVEPGIADRLLVGRHAPAGRLRDDARRAGRANAAARTSARWSPPATPA